MIDARIRVPGSKSITQRAIVTAFLAEGKSRLIGPLRSEDTLLLRNALELLGGGFKEEDNTWIVSGTGGRLMHPQRHPADIGRPSIYMGNNGTGIRFLASICCLIEGGGELELTGTRRMEDRPIEPLLSALRAWGADIRSIKGTGAPPVLIRPGGIKGGKTLVDASKSSQYLSSLLLVAPYTRKPSSVALKGGLASSPYLGITLSVMDAFGVRVSIEDKVFRVPRKKYWAIPYEIEGDASSASYFFAAAAVTGRAVLVENLPEGSIQGDAAFVDILERMGCKVEKGPFGIIVKGPGEGGLRGIDIDMGDLPDMVPTLAVVAAFSNGVTTIRGCPHLRIKETDRLKAVCQELRRMGGDVEELPDGLIIRGGKGLFPASIKTYDDHRIAMSFAVAGLKVKGLEIQDPECVKKSFPDFWGLWKTLL